MADAQASRDLKTALLAFAVAAVGVAAFVRLLDFEIPAIGHLGSALVAVTLLYAPVFIAWRREVDLATFGFTFKPLGRSLAIAGIAALLVFPIFIIGYGIFYDYACAPDPGVIGQLAELRVCNRFGGWDQVQVPGVDLEFGNQVLVQLVVVALPEELFFRGMIHELLERAIPPKRRFLGGGIGWALIISSLLFAMIHLPKSGDPRVLATFFPGLMFGWMRSATGSIVASTLTHAGSNLLVHVVEKMFLR